MVQPPAEVQVTLPPFSGARMYRVRPFPLTRTVPSPGTLAARKVTEALDALEPPVVVADPAAGLAGLVTGGVDDLVDEAHAAKRMEAPAKAAMGKTRARCRLERTSEIIWASLASGSRCMGVIVIRPTGRQRFPHGIKHDVEGGALGTYPQRASCSPSHGARCVCPKLPAVSRYRCWWSAGS